ncbi:Addiction module toxin, RelE/StbE family [Chlamydiales bacterium STE3]|nr:Addiction module toxin, RelE/StbE family [Chlamydiales bacterium STE3]
MLKTKIVNSFKKDLKKFNHNQQVILELDKVLQELMLVKELDPKYCNHPLSGEWYGSKECHIKPDVLLIYRIDVKEQVLILERISSHAELFHF